MTELSIPATAAQRFIRAAFASQGFNASAAEKLAALMVEADLHGSDGHGIIRLPQYIKRIRAGGINKDPNIRVVREQAATALVDGDNGMGHLVVSFATELAIGKARKNGVAWVNTRMSNHAGPASLYVRQVVGEGLICLYFAVGNANHLAPWGGKELMLSTNPIAVGLPTRHEPPVILDMATAMAAYGKVKAKAKRGEMMPPGWMIDREGQPLLDPGRSAEGLLLPIGGYKGYGLALVVGLLAGTLGGAAMGRQVIDFNSDHTSMTNTGQTVVVIDPAAFGAAEEFRKSADTVVRDIRSSERLPGVDRIWLPGEQSFEKHARYATGGFPLSQGLLDELNALAQELGIATLTSKARITSTVPTGPTVADGPKERATYAVLRPEQMVSRDRGGGARTTPLLVPAVGEASFINGITEFAGGAAVPFHSHNCAESVVLLSGRACLDVAGVTHELRPFDTTYIAPNVSHRFRNLSSTEPMKILWIYARPDATRTLTETGETRPVAIEHVS